jgi:hypothetical protein
MDGRSNQPISEQWHRAARDWVEAEDAAQLLEETKSSVFSEMVNKVKEGEPGMAHNAAESLVKASSEWRDYVKQIVKARTKANYAKVERDYMRMRFSEWVSEDANHRQGARL